MFPRSKRSYSVQRTAYCVIKGSTLFAFLCISAVLTFGAVGAYAQQDDLPPAPKDPIVVNGDKVEYLHDQKVVIGTGNVVITYKDVVLTCDKITVHLDTREALCEGNVKVRQKDAYFTGSQVSYNFETRQGQILDGYLNAYPMYGRAKELDKAAEKDEFTMKCGYVSTCDLPHPHYRIEAKQVEVYIDDKVVARNIVAYIGNVPVMYLPYYCQPLNTRKTHINVIPGQDSDWGYYVLTAYRYYFRDWSRGDVLLDYRSKLGLGVGVNHYLDTPVGDGAFKVYYAKEDKWLTFDREGQERTRYRYQYRHRWDMHDVDSYLILELNKLSDKDVIKDYFYNEYEEIGDKPDNYLSIITTKRDYTTEFLIRPRLNKFYEVVERLPEYNINIYNYKIGNTNFYYGGEASAVYLNKKYDNTNTSGIDGQKDVGTIRVDTHNQLSYAARLFRSLSTTPYVGIRETYYSRNKWGDTNLLRTVINAGVDNQIKFYKIYDVNTDVLGLDINKLRHVITPSANYYFQHQPTISPDNLNQFDDIDALDAQNGVYLALENRLQTKRGDPDNMKSVDLATLIVSSDYMFRLEKNNFALKSNKFRSVDFQLELIPYSWAYLVSKMSVDTKRYSIQTGSVDLVLNGGEKWQLVMSERYEHTETDDNHLLSLDATYKINEKWKIRAYERMNLSKMSFEEQEYTITRDMHCWVLQFIYNIKEWKNHSYWLVMRLKAFPEYPIGYRQTLSRPRFGDAGAQE